MATELNLRFPDKDHVIVRLGPDDDGSGQLPFVNPITDEDLRDIQWYIETYGTHSLGDPDDQEAARIVKLLPQWGEKLFSAAFPNDIARSRFLDFLRTEDATRLLTISAEHPAILSLPWELLHYSQSGGSFLFMANPRISIRRRVSGASGVLAPFKPAAKDSLHLLFVVSRPTNTGFLDPRADAVPVLDAIDANAPGRVTCEFLRPPTLDALVERLEDRTKPPVDIMHFDGHGVFDKHGNLPNRAAAAQTMRIAHLEEMLREKKVEVPVDPKCPPNMGYLLFEKADGSTHFVSAEALGENLHRHRVSLVILSACQSAAVNGEEESPQQQPSQDGQPERPMGSVAARLTATGIPSVLAMTHTVLVATTRTLFGVFYKELARHRGIGEALDNSRRYLYGHPEKYQVQRGPERLPLNLYDWFLPALYQQGQDIALLKQLAPGSLPAAATPTRSNLPAAPEAGFYGRRHPLWQIERWFAGSTRRITLTGFGGQGKTALAQEAGRWLLRSGLFRAAVFVDYARVQTVDAVSVAKNAIGSVLDQTFMDAAEVSTALRQTPTLVILDNLEALTPESLRALLDAAVLWSEAGASRVLCTTRQPDFHHTGYKVGGTHLHRRIQLIGLGNKQSPDDALEWCAALMKLPPAPTQPPPSRVALIELFDRVQFHPLSLRVLAQQLKTRPIKEIGQRLETLLHSAGSPSAAPSSADAKLAEDTPAALLASLELSLDKLDAAAREVLPRLGVFQGGAFEAELIVITGLGDAHENRRHQLQAFLASIETGDVRAMLTAMGQELPDGMELSPELMEQLRPAMQEMAEKVQTDLASLPPPPAANLWPGLRRQLEAAALIETEDVPGLRVPHLRFHPTLAPLLWAQLPAAERERLTLAHRQRYYALSGYLYEEDSRSPHEARAIAWRELPNLLHAVHAALDAGDADAVDFADNVNKFLGNFGFPQEAALLTEKAQAVAVEEGSQAWYLVQSNRGEQLWASGHGALATKVFQDILQKLGEAPSYKRAATLGQLGRCSRASGRPDLAVQRASDAIAVCDELEQSDLVKQHRSTLLADKAGALAELGQYAEARKAYGEGLKIDEDLKDLRGQGVTLGELGTLAIQEGDLAEALERHRAALSLFQQLREPAMEAVVWHQLGRVFLEMRRWDEAERHYRESARIKEENGLISGFNGATTTWNQLAIVSKHAGKLEAAEKWYQRAIEGGRKEGDKIGLSKRLSNLASLLLTQPGRLAEARILAEEALAIMQTLDPGAGEIWKTYNILAQIAERGAEAATDDHLKAELQNQAREYRRLARERQRNFAGTRHQLRQHGHLIVATIAACAEQPNAHDLVARHQAGMRQGGPDWNATAIAIDRILAGERDEASLCDGLGSMPSMIIEAILAGLADPSTLSDLIPDESSDAPPAP